MVTCKQSEKELAGDEWTLGDLSGVSAEEFWTWVKTDTIGYAGNPYLAIDKCVKFERELWFELGKCMRRKHRSVYQDHMKYVHNDIVKPLKDKTLCYTKRVRVMNDLANFLSLPPMKGEITMEANWSVRNKELTTSDLQLAIKDGLPKNNEG